MSTEDDDFTSAIAQVHLALAGFRDAVCHSFPSLAGRVYCYAADHSPPRGFNSLDPRTLNGTVLVLRALAVLQKYGSLPCWVSPAPRQRAPWKSGRDCSAYWGFSEMWTSSCVFGSPHQKQFRFLSVWGVAGKHLLVRGRHSKAATYTPGLVHETGRVFSKALRKQRRQLQERR